MFYFEHPHLRDLDWAWALQRGSLWVGHSRESLNWALQEDSTPLQTLWALQAVSGVGHSRETLGKTVHSKRLWGWALQGDSEKTLGLGISGNSGHSRETLGLGTPGVSGWAIRGVLNLCNWAVQGVSRSRPGEEKSSGRGEELNLKSNNPTPKVGKNPCLLLR